MSQERQHTGPGEPRRAEVTPESVWDEYERDCAFKNQLNLYDTVEANENFYIGKQWEGVQANGLPTPVFNFIKRIVLFLVASIATDNLKIAASPLPSSGMTAVGDLARVTDVINAQFEAIGEQVKLGKQLREFMRNAAVDGDACLYAWFDPEAETGQAARGTIRTELLENTRVCFGNPNRREVQEQPYLIIARRERLADVAAQARAHGGAQEGFLSDSDPIANRFDAMTDGKVTTLTRFWKEEGRVRAVKTTRDGVIRPAWDTGMTLYPIAWLSWDYVPNCYHGHAAVTGLIPNQIFVNKMFAMTMISLMTTAYPKIVYDKTRISKWDSGVGKAIGVNGGSVTDVARAIDPAVISPQVGEFISLAISLTKEFMGATDAALGNTKPDNTSAIIALQKASSVPMELTRQNFYQCVEDLGRIWLDQMRAYYGVRYVDLKPTEEEKQAAQMAGISLEDVPRPTEFDFGILNDMPLSIKLDVGGSAYWSEIAQMNTLDNLLTSGQINVVDYLERVPNGYISNQQELIETLRQRLGMAAVQEAAGPDPAQGGASTGGGVPAAPAGGMGPLLQAVQQTGAEELNRAQ